MTTRLTRITAAAVDLQLQLPVASRPLLTVLQAASEQGVLPPQLLLPPHCDHVLTVDVESGGGVAIGEAGGAADSNTRLAGMHWAFH